MKTLDIDKFTKNMKERIDYYNELSQSSSDNIHMLTFYTGIKTAMYETLIAIKESTSE